VPEELDLPQSPGTEHGMVERRDSLDGDFRSRGLMDRGSIQLSSISTRKDRDGKGDSHDDAVRAFSDNFDTAVVGCDFKVFHYGYEV
jgi:hypothetical protein